MYEYPYEDTPDDSSLKKFRLENEGGKNYSGTEMNESYGWGETYHQRKKTDNPGILSRLSKIFSQDKET